MRTTLVLDDELLRAAASHTGLRNKSVLVREALKALIERESARQLARLGGSEPELAAAPRRGLSRKCRMTQRQTPEPRGFRRLS
jgi:Arc/MetJ family transcription regulator